MKKRLQRWFSTSEPQQTEASVRDTASDTIGAERELQTMRMELEAREQRIAQLTQEVSRLRGRQDALIAETVSARLETLAAELAAPASQVRTQAYLLEAQHRLVQAQDVLAVAKRMVRALERNGVTFEGEIGAQETYDPNRHMPINAAAAPRTGDPVTVRFSGVRYQGKMIQKAIVE